MGNNNSNNIDDNIIKNLPVEIMLGQKQLISKGEYSNIYKSKNDMNENISLKIINKNNISKIMNNINQIDLDKYIQEKIDLMKEINYKAEYSIKINSNIIKDGEYIIEMEYCYDNLKQYFDKNFKEKGMELNEIKDIFNKLNSVLSIMNERNIFHGDIKPEHILISEKDGKEIIPKFIDYFSFNSFSKKYNLYNAPELIIRENKNNEINIKSDLWSMGLIMYELYFNCLPFKTKDELDEIIKNQRKLNLLKTENNHYFNDLIGKTLIININDRISFHDYINHNFWKREPSPKIFQQINSQKKNIDNEKINFKKDVKKDKSNTYTGKQKQIIFEFKTDNYEKELNVFTKNDLKNIEIFKFSGFNSKKTNLEDKKIFQWLKNLKFQKLRKLYLNENDIINIEGFKDLKFENLTHLYLDSNKINDLKELLQVKFENLLLLDLSQNEIINIENLSKIKFKKLSVLNLSENKISDISPIKNLECKNLKILNLGFNQIKVMDILSKVPFIDLKSLYLNNNQIQNIEVFSSVPFEQLEILNLSNNNINKIISLNNSKFKTLKSLDLSFNKIDNIEIIKSSIFVDNLESINLSFNKLYNTDAFEDMKLKSIKKISVYGNDSVNYDSLYVKEIVKNLKNKHINIFI